MGWLLDLRSQVRRILPARYGGTGNDQSAAQLTAVTCRVRQTGAAITRGMVVRMNGPYLVDPIASSTADDAFGVVLGKLLADGRIDASATAGQFDNVAVVVAGVCQALLDEDVVKGEYAFPTSTSGAARGETDPDTGTFGRFVGDGSAGGFAAVKLGGGGGGGGGSLVSPLTTKGDVWGFSTTDARVAVGSNGQVLTADSSQSRGVSWQTPGSSTLTTKGDLLTRTSSALARLAVGATNGMRLAARSGETTGLLWEVDKAEVECELVGPTAGQESRAIRVPYDCVITGWTIAANPSGSCVIDVWKDTLANFPPTVGDTITASAKPTLSAARTATSTTLTGWTTALSEGDWVVFKVDSASSITEVVIALHLRRA